MKRIAQVLSLVFVLTAHLAFAADATTEKPADAAKAPSFKAHVLSRAEFDALVSHPEKIVIIDLRRPDELTEKGGFPVYLSIQIKDLANSLAYIPKDRTVITVSNHAGRGGKGADLLADNGFKVAGTIGVEGYAAEGGVLTKISAPPPKVSDASTPN